MPIVKLESGVVVQVWRDVHDLDALSDKYKLSGSEYVVGDAPAGQIFDGDGFVNPPPPTPSTDTADYTLTPTRWRHMVRSANLWDHIDTVKAHLKANDLLAWADLMETLEGSVFHFQATLDQIASFAPLLPDVTLPDEATLTPLWLAAAER